MEDKWVALREQCSEAERQSILGYCCYLASSDGRLASHEVELVRRIAAEISISDAAAAKLARYVRQGRVRPKKPATEAGRRLLFHLAVEMGTVDGHLADAERAALERLAEQLRLPEDFTAEQLREVS